MMSTEEKSNSLSYYILLKDYEDKYLNTYTDESFPIRIWVWFKEANTTLFYLASREIQIFLDVMQTKEKPSSLFLIKPDGLLQQKPL